MARTALEGILSSRGDVDNFESADDAVEALEKLRKNVYDVLLLDIHMPELSGLELVDELKKQERPLPSVVFVTAYQNHALAAFEKRAVDYVLKPFSEERINEALDAAFRRTEGERAALLLESWPQLQSLSRSQSSKIAIKARGRILLIDPAEVVAAEAEGNYVLLRRQNGSDLLRESISVVAEKLRPYGFVRIHRSVLINIAYIEEIHPWVTGDYVLRIKGGKQYTASRSYKKNLRSIAASWIGATGFSES
jgi:DNA-binding LytR/AlgR family response regulator